MSVELFYFLSSTLYQLGYLYFDFISFTWHITLKEVIESLGENASQELWRKTDNLLASKGFSVVDEASMA
jgi:hypothetical protein